MKEEKEVVTVVGVVKLEKHVEKDVTVGSIQIFPDAHAQWV